MSVLSVTPVFNSFNDKTGSPLEAGSIYIGTAGVNPLIATNQIAVYSDSTLLIPLPQPITTSGGYPMINGSPTLIYVGAADYSIAVLDKNGALVYSSLSNKTKLGLIDLSTDTTGMLTSTSVKYNQTPAEQGNSVVPTNYYQLPGNPLRQNADSTGVIDATTAATQSTNGRLKDIVQWTIGTYKIGAISLGQVTWTGIGYTSDSTVPAGVTLTKSINGTQIALTGNDSQIEQLGLDGVKASFTGNGLQLAATRQRASYISSHKQASDGFLLGGTGPTGTFNANLWRADRLIATNCGGYGFRLNHSGGTVTAQFPNGTPDVNAGVMIGGDFSHNTLGGGLIDNTIDNAFLNPVFQTNTGKGITLTANSLGNKFFGFYAEGNNGGGAAYGDEMDILLGAYNNYVVAGRTPPLASNSGVRDANPPSKNWICLYETTIGGYAVRGKINIWNELADVTGADFCAYKGTNYVNIANIRNTVTGANGGRCAIETKIDGGAVTERIAWLSNGDVNFKNATAGWVFIKTTFDTTTTGFTIEAAAGRADIVNSGAGVKTVLAFYDASGAAGSVSTNGAGTAAYNTTSDVRAKQDIIDVPSQRQRIDSIRIVECAFKANPTKRIVTVLAHELQQVASYAVTGQPGAMRQEPIYGLVDETYIDEVKVCVGYEDPETKSIPIYRIDEEVRTEQVEKIIGYNEVDAYQGVDFSKLVPVLIADAQESHREVIELRAQLRSLLDRVLQLEGSK